MHLRCRKKRTTSWISLSMVPRSNTLLGANRCESQNAISFKAVLKEVRYAIVYCFFGSWKNKKQTSLQYTWLKSTNMAGIELFMSKRLSFKPGILERILLRRKGFSADSFSWRVISLGGCFGTLTHRNPCMVLYIYLHVVDFIGKCK